ncbi:MAG: LysE family translocator [Alphaproteobacteria bacterium]
MIAAGVPVDLPVDLPVLAAFVAATLLLVLSPGPDTMLILRYTTGSGRATGLATVAGVQTGLAVHTFAAAAGLSLLVAASPAALGAVATAGAAYLAWLGWQSFRAGVLPLDRVAGQARIGPLRAWRDAMLTNLLNPKVVLLFLALMPQFLRPNGWSVPAQTAVLGVTLILVNTVWQTVVALLADAVRRWLGHPLVQRAVSWATGAVLIGFAVLMLRDFVFGG